MLLSDCQSDVSNNSIQKINTCSSSLMIVVIFLLNVILFPMNLRRFLHHSFFCVTESKRSPLLLSNLQIKRGRRELNVSASSMRATAAEYDDPSIRFHEMCVKFPLNNVK